jgi:hypothetical protein
MSLRPVGDIIGGVAIAMNAHRLPVRTLVGVGSLLLGGSSVACLAGVIVSGVLGEVVGIGPVIAAQGAGYIESDYSTRCVQYCAGSHQGAIEDQCSRSATLSAKTPRTGRQINVC